MRWSLLVLALLALIAGCGKNSIPEKPTFNRDVAPIVFENCVGCHYPDGASPFPLTNYREVKKRAKQIAQVAKTRYMPPWLPAPGHGDFAGARILTEAQITILNNWVENGAPEGAKKDLKVEPKWIEGWQLGPPDLVVTMPVAYTLPAGGKDIYRNFVIPDVVPTDRYVSAFQFQPGKTQAVHHAFVKIDRKGDALRLEQKESEPGFPGMTAGPSAEAPQGTFASWQPGRQPERRPADMPWVLPGKSDLILQLHMRPTGKPETIQASVAFYFSKDPPKRLPMVMCLRSTSIDIPAGATDYAIENSYTVPVNGSILSVLPHQHYLGKEMRAWADLPDGSKKDLLLIKQWDFNWQGSFRYTTPVSLPAGSTVRMRFTFDNSTNNPRNPNQPPQRVRYGQQSADEMGEFWFQFISDRPEDMTGLERDYVMKCALPDKIVRARNLLQQDENDAVARTELAMAFFYQGKLEDAKREATIAVRDDPKYARPHELLGSIYVAQNLATPARIEFAATLELEPDNAKAHNNLGYILLVLGKPAEAIPHLEKAIALHPDDTLARKNLEKAKAALVK